MARQRLAAETHAAAAATHPAIDEYLAQLGVLLRGPSATRGAVLDELRDGLLEAQRAHSTSGLDSEEAAARAIGEFGDPGTVAAAFAPELAAHDARRVALALVRTGPLIGVAWGMAALASGLAVVGAPPWRWPVPGIQLVFPAIAAALLASALAAALALTVTGRLGARSRADGRATRLAATGATTIALSAVICDVALLVLLLVTLTATPQSLEWLPVTIAAAASMARLAFATHSARRLARARARLD